MDGSDTIGLFKFLRKKDAKYWYEEAKKYRSLKKADEALEAYNKAIELDPHNYRYWYEKAQTLGYRKRDEALQAYDKAIELCPQLSVAWDEKAQILMLEERYEEALQAYDKLIELYPQDFNAWNMKFRLLIQMGRDKELLYAYNKSKAVGYTGWGEDVLVKLGKYEEALKVVMDAIVQDNQPTGVSSIWLSKAIILKKMGRLEDAEGIVHLYNERNDTNVKLDNL